MHWKRRRSKWPYMVALVGLFGLTLFAPSTWQRSRSVPESLHDTNDDAGAANLETRPKLAAKKPTQPIVAPTLPPLSGPMVVAEDYVAVDDPAAEPSPALDSAGPSLEAPAGGAGASPLADGLALRPADRRVKIYNVAAPEPAKPLFTVESLAKVRSALVAIVEQAREKQAAAMQLQAPRVMVDSADDRLAMIPPRDFSLPRTEIDAAVETPTSEPEESISIPDMGAPQPEEPAMPPALRHRPEALIAQLDELSESPEAADWARRVRARVDELTQTPAAPDQDWQPALDELKLLAEQGFSDAVKVANAAGQSAWIRTTRGLDRRLPVWSLLLSRDDAASSTPSVNEYSPERLIRALNEFAAMAGEVGDGAAWRQYLRIDDLAGLASVGGEEYVEARRAAARDVLIRMASPWLTAAQQAFLAQPPLVALATELRPWASGETSLDTLAAFIERYESTGSLRDADAIAELRLRMKWSSDPKLQQLAEDLNRNYRNANLRVAFSGELMNRMIPPQAPQVAPVRSQIAGADVRGHSQTETAIKVRLLPDPAVWRFGLEAFGKVSSRTTSQTWPAQVRNASQMEYEVRKLVLINRNGLHVFPAEAHADGDTSLVGVESSFAAIPIIGSLVESAAREQHRMSRPQAIAQVKEKVSSEARQRMDREADARLARLRGRYREHVAGPLERFALNAEPVDMSTTAERASMRLRLAGEQHLAAHTPRPSAPSDSLASFQLHESVFNNAVRGLGLDGRRMTVGELHTLLTEKIRRHAEAEPADLPAGAKVEFAAHDAVRVACQGDRIELVLNIVELRRGRDSIRGVGVHAFFRPVVEGLEVKLVRDGTLQFDGRHLRTGPRLVLHSVFGKLLPKDQEVPVLAAKLSDDPRFAGLMVTQLVIEDGWVGLSLGPATPHRTAWRTRGATVTK